MFGARIAKPTVSFVDEYCELYKSLFPEVRSFEAFKHLHIGMISDIKRKSLPAIARVVGLENEQSLPAILSLRYNKLYSHLSGLAKVSVSKFSPPKLADF